MALDLNALIAGIYTKLNISSITDLVTGVFHFKAPQGQLYPYITYFIVSDVSDDTFEMWRDDVLLQIDVWSDSNSASEAGNIAKAVAAQMDEASISATGYSVYFCQRGATRLLYEIEPKIFHKLMEYRIIMEKSKT